MSTRDQALALVLLAGSPADSCATCHRSGDVEDWKSPGGVECRTLNR